MSIAKVVDTAFNGAKGITDIGAAARNAAGKFGDSIRGSTLKTNLAKYGLIPAVAGGGIALGTIGIGAGVSASTNIVTDGFKGALDLTDKDGDGIIDNGLTGAISSISSWIIFILIALAIVYIVKFATSGKGGKK